MIAFDPELDVIWSPGRHNYRINAWVHQMGLKLLHYRYFGEDYLAERNAQNYARRSSDDVTAGCGFHCAPDHTGKYSPEWWKRAASVAEDITA